MNSRNPSAWFMLCRTIRSRFFIANRMPFFGWFIALLFSGCAHLSRLIYRFRILSEQEAEGCVVSIGNVVVGGTGKTQVVLWLMERLKEERHRIAILSRGYKGKLSSRKFSVPVDLNKHQAKDVGDEPYLMRLRCGDIPVIIGKDRLLSAGIAKNLKKSVLFLDDGLQFRKIKKDINIIVVNGSDPFGGGRFFPQGRLRDSPSRLNEADFIIVNGDYDPIVERGLEAYSPAPKIFVRPVVKEIFVYSKSSNSNEESFLLNDIAVGVFCGLGNPQSFISTVEQAGGVVVNEYFLPDHDRISLKELRFFSSQTRIRGGERLLCSEKDFVKIPHEWLEEDGVLPLGVVRPELELVYNQDAAVDLINFIKEKSRGTHL